MRSATRGMLFHQNNSPADTSSHTMADIRNAWYELLHHPSPLTARSGTTWLLFVSKAERTRKKTHIFWRWGRHMYSK